MTRRWISDVPSKMVKIFGLVFLPLVSRIYAGKGAYSSALLCLGRTATAIYGPEMLPAVLPQKDRAMPPLTQGIDEPTESRFIHYDPTSEPPLPQPEPPQPMLTYRLAAFGVRWLSLTSSRLALAAALYVLATGQL